MESLLRRDTRKAGENRLIDRLSECLIGQEMGIDCLFPVAGLHGKCFLVSQLVEVVFGIKPVSYTHLTLPTTSRV